MAGEALSGGSEAAPASGRLPRLRARLRALRLDERGTAVVEFALVAPILFLLVFGILDFGRALNYYNQQTQLVGLGARAAVVGRCPDGSAIGGSTCSSIQQQLVQDYSTGELHNKTRVCISFPNGTAVGDPVTVTASFDFTSLPYIGGTIAIKASQSERLEATPTFSAGCYPS